MYNTHSITDPAKRYLRRVAGGPGARAVLVGVHVRRSDSGPKLGAAGRTYLGADYFQRAVSTMAGLVRNSYRRPGKVASNVNW